MQPMAIPDGLADTPPGPSLGALLAGIDPARVANGDTVTVLQAWRRQRSHTDAAEFAVMTQVGRCDPASKPSHLARLETPDPNCGIEIAAALTLTELSAWREHTLAETLVHRLPDVHAALACGDIDRGKAAVFADLLEPLTNAQNARICAALLPKAPGLTTGQLRARLRRMVIAIDPDAARRRYNEALRQRRVICYLGEDGTATITITGLDPTAAQAACERVDALARDVRAAGHPEALPIIRADLATALLDGSLHTLSHDDIVSVMLARATAPAPETESGTGAGPVSTAGADDHDSGGHRNSRRSSDVGNDDGDGSDSDEGDGEDSDGGGHGGGGGDDGPRDGGPGAGGPARPEPARSGIEVRLRLSTLLGHDEHPGEIPGLGPILAPTARTAVARQQQAEWRFAITDPDGSLVLAGITRRRPPTPSGQPGQIGHPLIRQAHGGIVELQVPATLLEQLSAQPPPGWETLIADLATQYAGRTTLASAMDQRPGDRLPCPALRRHVEVRDRTCVFPGCRRPARKAQQDHTKEHQHGGVTVSGNLGPLCVLHHALKTAGHWHVHQPEPGEFRWRSPLGRAYATRGEPVCPPLPDSLPGPVADRAWPEPQPPGRAQRELDDKPLYPSAPMLAPAEATAATTAERAPPEDPPF